MLVLRFIFNCSNLDTKQFPEEKPDQMVNEYVEARVVTSAETLLELLASITTKDNYMEFTCKIDAHPVSSELDLLMYIYLIADERYTGLKKFIETKLQSFKDADAIEDLNNALKKIKPE